MYNVATNRIVLASSQPAMNTRPISTFVTAGYAEDYLFDWDDEPTVVWNTTYGGCFLLSVEDERGRCTYRLYGGEHVIKIFDSEPRILQATSVGLLLCAEKKGETHYYLLCEQYKV